jgi:hypothetical protein
MRFPLFASILVCGLLFAVPAMSAQDAAAPSPIAVVPRLIKFSGSMAGAPSSAGIVELRFAVYEGQTGGAPLWQETQQVTLNADGKYSVLLGAATPGGMPVNFFTDGRARWLGVALSGQQESARMALVAAPYALKANDAETLGGHSAGDFALKNPTPDTGTAVTQINVSSGILGGGTGPTVSLSLDGNYLAALGNGLYAPKNAVVATLTGKSGVDVTHTGTAYTVSLDGAYLSVLGNSAYAQLAGANLFKSTQSLAALGTGTATKGFNSNALKFNTSAYNTSTGSPEALDFSWQAEPAGNDTTAPSASMNLLFNTGTNAPAETGLKIGSNGKITFAAGQIFPGAGTGTITGVTAGTDLTGGGTSGAVTLNLNTAALQTANDARYTQLGGSPTFSYVTVQNTLSAGAITANTGDSVAAALVNDSDFDATLTLEATNTDGPIFSGFNSQSGAQCYMDQDANFTCSGALTGSNAVHMDRRVETYAVQSAENWIEDFGSAKLANGSVTVALDPAFGELVNTGVEYHVYLTPDGDSQGLYVSAKGPLSFEVRESHAGTSSIAFDYRIVAKHKGTEKLRLADITDKMKRAMPGKEVVKK